MVDGILGRRAVVIGGSIAGLLSARVLADFFKEIIIVEADDPWDALKPRNKVPQSHHSHVLLERGQKILDWLFPGFIRELIQNGSVVIDFTNDLKWFHFGEWKKRFPSGIQGVQQTRPFLEWHIINRVNCIPNITFRNRSTINGFILSDDQKTLQGVKVQDRSSLTEEKLMTDLVVDASGAGSQTLKWLNIEKDEKDTAEIVKIDLFYATRFYKTENVDRGWMNLMISAKLPDYPYAGVVLPFEDQKIGVTLGGYLREPPKTVEDFERIAQLLPQPHIYNFIKEANPISELKIYKIPSQSRKRSNIINKIPDRFAMIGDSYCRFDPLYGQGMTVAAMEAELLLKEFTHLSNGETIDTGLKNYWSKLPNLTSDPWNMAITEAYRHPDIPGIRPIGIGLKQWLTKRIYKSSAKQSSVYLLLAQVMNMTHPSSIFFKPSVLWKLFR